MKHIIQLALLSAVMGSVAFAHSGVKDPTVMARMNLMTDISANMKALGQMIAGQTSYDGALAQRSAAALRQAAEEMPARFEQNATDPKSESRPEIWTDWDGFVSAARAMELAAMRLEEQAEFAGSGADLNQAFKDISETCTSCHKTYRLKK